ncbi:hypothetical protein ABID22_002827 [Pontibacter aydingkolensis]|uniref:T9SS type A sorting domain-containing protein n=1 Tax=Pontibacter aydingkolensis TaxID=1911536 RepID=A0ABS7CX34_9BACT|nr:T9SS type A sorting domain-containing protein [Pontibacter aydingkolensis]MBW7468416.1 T9SS type A sorting domain-containing protein [Pontibacter aydingkolensis]
MKYRLLLIAVLIVVAPKIWAANILIYGPMLASAPNEKTLAEAAGHVVTVVTGSQWLSMTTADFQSFDAIIIPDNACSSTGGNSDPNLTLINSNKSVWAPAVTGNLYMINADPLFHRQGQYQALLTNAINFVTSGSGTGFYVCLSCIFHFSQGVQVQFLSFFGDFVIKEGGMDNIDIVETTHPTMVGLTDLGLSHWGYTAHGPYLSYSSSRVITIATANSLYPVIVASPGVTNNIATSALESSSLCAGVNISIPYSISGSYNTGNVFTAQLSNASGSFASPTSIGTVAGTTSGTINATVPANTPTGTGYRIRVVSSDPAVTGSDNGSDIIVNNIPTLTVSNPNPVCSPTTVNLATTITSSIAGLDLTYWDGDPDEVASQELQSSSVSSTGTYWIQAENLSGCTAKASVSVTVNSLGALVIGSPITISNPSGSPITTVALGTASTTYQVVNPESGVSYSWSVTYNSGGSEVLVSSGTGTSVAANWLTDIARVYKVKVNSSIAGCDDKQEEIYVAVYDPTAGFVTGGGWITSPEGAYKPLEASGEYISDYISPEGKANFGFVSKYKKGSTTVEGNTEFHFQDGNLKFKSLSHTAATLVVSTCRATYKGEGTIEGSELTYKFMVSVIDGQINGGGNIDKFRIKILEKTSGKIVYDNLIDADENYDLNVAPTTILGGGSIVIHIPMKASSGKSTVAIDESQNGTFYTYPTAFSNRTTIAFTLNKTEDYVLEVFDMKGALVKKIASGTAEANKLYEFELRSDGMAEGVYVTRLSTSTTVQSLKAVLKR